MAAQPPQLDDAPITRLNAGTAGTELRNVKRLAYDRQQVTEGIVHLGVGAFMRAHLAVYCDDVIASGATSWAIAGVSLRRRDVFEQLDPQDCLYTLAVQDNVSTSRRILGALKSIHFAPENPGAIVELLASKSIHVVTTTVTEKGYCLAPDSGSLDTGNADLAHDLAKLERPRTTLGFLVAGMQTRVDRGGAPLTVVCCDNMPANGKRLRSAVLEFASRARPDLVPWIESSVTFPSTMVDRIVPATLPADIDETAAVIGVRDEATVRAEPFCQWVIEDSFAGPRPPWETAGALFVGDVELYERTKLRLLNGPHSALAYLGYLAGYEYIHDAMQDPVFERYARNMMLTEISPVTAEPAGMEHRAYVDSVLQRFGNSALRHRCWQIAMDGSQKLPQRILDTLRLQLRRGGPIAGLSLAVAAWLRYVGGVDESGQPIDVRDPFQARFAAIATGTLKDPQDLVLAYLQIEEVFGTDLRNQPRLTTMIAEQLRLLTGQGAVAAVHDYVDGCGIH